MGRLLFLTLLTVNLFKLWAMNLFPITCDEAYYWLWHQHLQLSYVDHPPFIAYFNKLVSYFGEYNLFNFRLAGLILFLTAAYFIYKTGRMLFGEKAGIIAAAIFQLVPHYIIVWQTLTVDNPLALFWIASLYFAAKIAVKKNPADWYFLAVSFGLGMLTKYTMAFFLLPFILFLLVEKEQRRWFLRPEPYLAFLLAALMFSPVLFWNFQHDWVSFAFHFSRLGQANFAQNLTDFLGDQLAHFTPFLFLGLLIYSRQLWRASRLLFLFSIPLLLTFAGLTYFIKLWAHWATAYQFAAVVGIGAMVSQNYQTARRLILAMGAFALILTTMIIASSPMLLPRQELYRRNYQLAEKYQALPKNTYIITPYLGISSQLAFYARRPTYMARDYLKIEDNGFGQKQFDLWGFPLLKRGDNVVYFGRIDMPTVKKLTGQFKKIVIRPELDVYLIESYLDDLVPYYCEGFLGKNVIL